MLDSWCPSSCSPHLSCPITCFDVWKPRFLLKFHFFLKFPSLDQVIFIVLYTSPLICQIWPECFVILNFQIWSFSIWEAKPKTLLSVAFETAVFLFPFMILCYATGLWSYDRSLGHVKDVIKTSVPRLGSKRNLVKAVRWKLTLLQAGKREETAGICSTVHCGGYVISCYNTGSWNTSHRVAPRLPASQPCVLGDTDHWSCYFSILVRPMCCSCTLPC